MARPTRATAWSGKHSRGALYGVVSREQVRILNTFIHSFRKLSRLLKHRCKIADDRRKLKSDDQFCVKHIADNIFLNDGRAPQTSQGPGKLSLFSPFNGSESWHAVVKG